MIAYITSIGESTTELCRWSLERQGIKTIVIQSPTSLWDKLCDIYMNATEDVLRVDADVIVNRNVKELIKQTDLWWYQSLCYGWFSQDVIHGGIQFVRREAHDAIRNNLSKARKLERPESYLYRLPEFHNPRVCGTFEKVCGLHGYKQKDVQRVKETKERRGQLENYDFELAKRIETL